MYNNFQLDNCSRSHRVPAPFSCASNHTSSFCYDTKLESAENFIEYPSDKVGRTWFYCRRRLRRKPGHSQNITFAFYRTKFVLHFSLGLGFKKMGSHTPTHTPHAYVTSNIIECLNYTRTTKRRNILCMDMLCFDCGDWGNIKEYSHR